jgi:hypothetical protein
VPKHQQRNVQFQGGRLPNDPQKPRVKLKASLTPVATTDYAPPDAVDNYSAVPADTWGMDGNDVLGDCTCAEVDHAVKTLQVAAGNPEVVSTDDEVVRLYELAAGYDPERPATDQGAVMQDIRNYWRTKGVELGGTNDKILLFAEIDINNENLVKWCVATFGEVGLGMMFPDYAMTQFNQGEPWDYQRGGTIEGGHAIALVGYDDEFYYVMTWGQVQKMTYQFFAHYVEEGWIQLSRDLVNAVTNEAPAHRSLYDLGVQFSELTGQANPVTDPTTDPVPDPAPPAPDPAPEPDPTPVDPTPTPDPDPAPTPDPTPVDPPVDPVPDPAPTPDPDPAPVPDPEPTPDPSPAPSPTPSPDPSPTPDPSPAPAPAPEPSPAPGGDDAFPVDALRTLADWASRNPDGPAPAPAPEPAPDSTADFPREEVVDWLEHTHHAHTEREIAASEAVQAWMQEHGLY